MKRLPLSGAVLTGLTYLLTLLIFFPILWMVLTSFKPEQLALVVPPRIFVAPTLENYMVAFTASPYLEFLWNTLVITLLATLLALVLGVPAAYAMAYYPTRRTNGTMMWIMSTRMLPPAGVIVPLYVIFRDIHWLDTYLGMIVVYAGMNFPLVVWMIRSFMLEVPYGILEAARLDGANLLQEFTHVLLPLLIPGLAATVLLCFIFTWNEFFLAVNLTTRQASPLSVYIASFKAAQGDLFVAKMSAAATATVLPVIAAGWATQRQLVAGLTLGAVK
ncbi:MAG: mannitol ABC transporter permease [Litorilinea sp.]|nr:MAG: mannitol ABC transporter permease [Litorilinea sp.]